MRTIFSILLFALAIPMTAQQNFIWEVIDSVSKSKNQIYIENKYYVSSRWKNANAVIQTDDKELGIIILKGASIVKKRYLMNDYEFTYSYLVTLKMKDNKYSFKISDVLCTDARIIGNSIKPTLIQPFEGENCPETGTMKNPGISKKAAIEMMATLKTELQILANDYKSFIVAKNEISDDW